MTFVNGEVQARFMARIRGVDPQRCLAIPVDVGKGPPTYGPDSAPSASLPGAGEGGPGLHIMAGAALGGAIGLFVGMLKARQKDGGI
jgi:hypothetical protein